MFSIVVTAVVIMRRTGRSFAQQNTLPTIRHQVVLAEDLSSSFAAILSPSQIQDLHEVTI